MGTLQFFPTTLWQARLRFSRDKSRRSHGSPSRFLSRFNEELALECDAFRRLDDRGRRWSKENYVQGYTSYSSITDLHQRSSRFGELKSELDREVMAFAKTLDMDLQGRRLELTSFWINMMGYGAHHSFHLHPLSAISGTYYVRVPKNSGAFKIEDPRIACFMGSPPRKASAREQNRRYIELSCQAGDVVLFESWLKHEVPANRSREERISVSFNYDWV